MRYATQYQVLLAVAMSELHQTNHALFMPPNTHYLNMLTIVKNKKLVEPIGEHFYKLTLKGWRKLKNDPNYKSLEAQDKAVDDFVDNL